MDCENEDDKLPGTAVEMKINDTDMDVTDHVKTTGLRRKATLNVSFCVKKERNASFKKVSRILQKAENERTEEEKEVISSCSEVVDEVKSRLEKRKTLKARSKEFEDTKEVLEVKCEALAKAVQRARHLVVYSGAGVSTAACIPDYRGSNGIWTRLQQGLDIGQHDLSKTQPTLTHMVLYTLYRRGLLKHVVSQNCDGLHLRSGLPRAALSEVHGNMYLEVCQPCKVEYWRLFDVTEHTGRYSHETARRCYLCHKPLRDTIVHFGERGGLKWPINWPGATAAANQADVILCIGSSLKVLKKYPWLWGMDRPVKKRPNLYIVNLQWTPKDEQAALKINGKCDEVMAIMMSKLSITIPTYDPLVDPIFVHATRLHSVETHTYSTAALEPPDSKEQNKRSSNENIDESPRKLVCIKQEADEAKPNVEENAEAQPDDDVLTKCVKVDDANLIIKTEDAKNILTEENNTDKTCLSNGCDGIKKAIEGVGSELDSNVENTNGSKNVSTSKSPSKGIWRPFFTDDTDSSASSSGVTKPVELETEPKLSQMSSLDTKAIIVPKTLDQTTSKKCLIQNEPLDLSCGKPKEPVVDKPNPYFCKYCRVHYHSGFCLFYRKQLSDNPPDPPCYCCDEEDEKDPLSPDTDAKSPDDSDKSTTKTAITNPGWFGKGYRKKIKKKR